MKRFLPVFLLLSLLLSVGIYVLQKQRIRSVVKPVEVRNQVPLSVLGKAPNWHDLEPYQQVIKRSEFERLLTDVFAVGDGWRRLIELTEHEARIDTGDGGDFSLRFAMAGNERPAPRYWKSASDLESAPVGRPLDGLHIAVDPGHIGGEWAKIEERWFQIGDAKPICEGDMTLFVAQLLKPRLESLGAKVSLVRDRAEPVTQIRPDDLLEEARSSGQTGDDPVAIRRLAERLFYRTAEIHARAERVNHSLQPDLVLCLHFNADAWGNPEAPTLVDRHHFHLLLNGAYSGDELNFADQRFSMLKKLLSGTHQEEARVGVSVADVYRELTQIPAFQYPPSAPNALPVQGHSCLWARNLLANRLYDCPVVFTEPYVMNSTIDYPRMQAGDYLGLKEINGKRQPSIFREYAETLIAGLVRYYSGKRPPISVGPDGS